MTTAQANVWERQKATGWRKWRWAIIAGSVVGLLLLLALLAPTVASMGWAKSLVLGQINSNLNGQVTVEDWSLGWWSGIDVRGVKVFDAQKQQVLEVGHLQTDLTVMQVVKGDYYTLGTTKVEGLGFSVTLDTDEEGNTVTNLEKLVKRTGGGSSGGVPKIVGDFAIDFHGTIEDRRKLKRADGSLVEGKPRIIYFDRSGVNVKVPDINGQIEHDIDLNVRVGDGAAGEITAKGTVKAFDGGAFDVEKFGVVDEVGLSSVDLGSLAPFLEADGPINSIKGTANGKLNVTFSGQDEMTASGDLKVLNFQASGPALKGDTYMSPEVALTVPATTFNRSTGRIRVGAEGKEEAIVLKSAQGTVSIALDATQEALGNLSANKAPGSEGKVTVVVDGDIQAMAKVLPKLMQLAAQVRVDGGTLHEQTTMKMQGDKTLVSEQLDLRGLAGFDAKTNRRISARPLSLKLDATSLGGGGVIPDLRNFTLALESGFARINGSGESIAKLKLSGTVDLAKAQAEAAQFFDFGKLAMDGVVDFSAATSGDLTHENGSAVVDVTVASKQLRVDGLTAKALNEPWMRASVKGKLVRGKKEFLESLGDATVVLMTGSEEKPTVDLKAMGDLSLADGKISLPKLEIEKLNVDLPGAQAELSPVLGILQAREISFPAGTVALSASGSYDAAAMKFKALKLVANGVSFERGKQAILSNESVTLELAGGITQDQKGMEARLSKLALADSSGMLKVDKEGGGELVVSIPKAGGFAANGRMRVDADLKAINDLGQKISGKEIVVAEGGKKRPGQLLSGRLTGTVEFARASGESSIVCDLQLNELGVTTFQKDIRNERVAVAIRGSAKDDLSAVTIGQLELRSSFMSAILSNAVFQLEKEGKAVGAAEMVQKMRLALDVPDLPRAKALAEAILPENALGMAGVEVLSGSARGTLAVNHAEKGLELRVEDFSAGQFAFKHGQGRWGPKDLTLALGATVALKPEGKTIIEQLDGLEINSLSGNLGMAKVDLREPVVIKMGAGAVNAAGTIKVDGRLQDIGELAAALRGEAAPGPDWDYAGDYTITQKFATEGGMISASAMGEARDFVYGGSQKGHAPFREGLLKLGYELTLNPEQKVLELKNLSVSMDQSKALNVTLSGKIQQYDTQPAFDLAGKLGYNSEAVMKLVWPQLPSGLREQLATLKVLGSAEGRDFFIKGKSPKPGAKAGEALDAVTAQINLLFEKIEYQGMVGERVEVPLYLANGKVTTIYGGKEGADRIAPAGQLNGGGFDPGGIELTLGQGQEPMRVTAVRPGWKVLDGVTINKEFVEKYLGSTNPLFAGASEARGVILLTIDDLKALRVDSKVTQPPPGDPGRVKIEFEVRELALNNPMIKQLHPFLNVTLNPDGSVPTAVHDAVAEMAGGKVKSHLNMELGGQTIQCKDAVINLADEKIEHMTLLIPRAILKNAPAQVPETLVVPVTGTLSNPKVDMGKAIAESVKGSLIPGKNGSTPGIGDRPGLPQKPELPQPGVPEKPSLPGKPGFGKPF